jgi:hypothetical protein
MPRTVWHEVIEARRRRFDIESDELVVIPMEHRTASDPKWLFDWAAVTGNVTASLRGAIEVDPREALVHVMAFCASWVDAMDQRPSPT